MSELEQLGVEVTRAMLSPLFDEQFAKYLLGCHKVLKQLSNTVRFIDPGISIEDTKTIFKSSEIDESMNHRSSRMQRLKKNKPSANYSVERTIPPNKYSSVDSYTRKPDIVFADTPKQEDDGSVVDSKRSYKAPPIGETVSELERSKQAVLTSMEMREIKRITSLAHNSVKLSPELLGRMHLMLSLIRSKKWSVSHLNGLLEARVKEMRQQMRDNRNNVIMLQILQDQEGYFKRLIKELE